MLVEIAWRRHMGHPPRLNSGHCTYPCIKEQAKERQQSKDMVKIRLMRVGMKGAPSYRVVVADARSPRDGRIIENIGWYNPLTEPSTITIDSERAQHWLNVGAQPTDSVRSLLRRAGIVPSTTPSSVKS